ncbi:MAG: glutamate mutase L [Anaerolineales bacterium]|nr:glutamate mutase L [Anaerolineales bacterium]
MKSILAAECGSTTTIAALIEQVGDEYRLQATGQTPSTYGPPWHDITIGVRQAIRHIEKNVGRTLLTSAGWPITPQNQANQGVDGFTVVCSAGSPLRVVIAGLMKDISLTSAQRAAATTYSHVTNLISLDASDGGHHTPEARIQAIKEGRPDIILLVGGTDGGATQPVLEMARVISMGLYILGSNPIPAVVYAGNQDLRPDMADILGHITALTSVPNVHPLLDVDDPAATQAELEKLYIQKKMMQLPGFDKLNNWSTQYPVIPASKSFEKLISFLGQYHQLNAVGVNVGSRSTTIATKTPDNSSRLYIRSDAGVGHSLADLLKAVPIEKFHRWLPFEMTLDELYNRLLNKSLYPTSLPTSLEDLMIEHAVAREAMRLVAHQTRSQQPDTQWNLIIGAGRTLTGSPHAAQAALLLIDGLEPWGVTSLVLDRNGLVDMLGAIAVLDPTAAVKAATHDAFLNLGTVVAPRGHARNGQTAVKVKVVYDSEETYETEVAYNTLEIISLPPGQKAQLEIRPTRQFNIGGQSGRAAKTEVEGGLLGIIVDARGRPLRFPADEEQRQEQLQHWLETLQLYSS